MCNINDIQYHKSKKQKISTFKRLKILKCFTLQDKLLITNCQTGQLFRQLTD